MLLALEQAHLTWMHNVVRPPSFRQEFDDNVPRNNRDKSMGSFILCIAFRKICRHLLVGLPLTPTAQHTLFHTDSGHNLRSIYCT